MPESESQSQQNQQSQIQSQPDQIALDPQEIINETATVGAELIANLTKQLAVQRRVNVVLGQRLADLQGELIATQEQVKALEKERDKPITTPTQAEAVLERVANGNAPSANGDKPQPEKVQSRSTTRPPAPERTN